ncbi:uncharacterized protein [Montipora foliosa]|uniref:uncharacterized protein n=1 Tax=Montipora foliosa TaxID=591990 RepID=UPI0035F1CC74
MGPNIIQVFVNGLQGGTTTINIQEDATIARLYALLKEKNGIPVDEQRLIFSGKEIRITDESNKQTRLSTYGIEKGSTLFLVLRLHGGSGKVLDDDVELSDAPDMLTWDDDPENKRAKMPCGHAITPESLTIYCRSLLDAGRSRFLCPYISQDTPSVYCGKEWDYIVVRRLAVLTNAEKKEFETKISKNHLFKAMGIQECPNCKSFVERINKKDVRLTCSFCQRKLHKDFQFCWHCLHGWVDISSTTKCGNVDCAGEDKRLKILRDCSKKVIVGVAGCPSLRACISCGMLIEHVKACKHMTCRCGKEFCFICLNPKGRSGWKCGSYNEACEIAPVQTAIAGA